MTEYCNCLQLILIGKQMNAVTEMLLKDNEHEMQDMQDKKTDQSIKMWSYNVFLRPPPIKNNNDDYKSERFALIVDKISQYDIICFQEMFQAGSFRVEDMIAAGISKGFQYWAVADPISFWAPIPVDSGLLVISRYPILQSKFSSFGLGVFSDSTSDKGYIYCKVDYKGRILHLFNLHLQASYLTADQSSYHKELSLAARTHQVKIVKKQITALLEKHSQERDLVLLIGDFNINAHDEKQCRAKSALYKAFIPEEFHEYEEFISFMEGKFDNEPIMNGPYRMRDLVYENYGYHPATYGEEALMVLTHKDEYGIPQRLDYAFQIERLKTKTTLIPIISQCVIEKAKVEGQPFTQLSDHFGITLKIMPTDLSKI